MKATINIQEITHDDVVNLFSTATYGNCAYDVEFERPKQPLESFEDNIAFVLKHGGSVIVYDNRAYIDDEPFHVCNPVIDKEQERIGYVVTLDNIKNGIERAFNDDSFSSTGKKIVCNMLQDGDYDMYEADDIMQYILFGEVVYG